jgi:hypothetical protein
MNRQTPVALQPGLARLILGGEHLVACLLRSPGPDAVSAVTDWFWLAMASASGLIGTELTGAMGSGGRSPGERDEDRLACGSDIGGMSGK